MNKLTVVIVVGAFLLGGCVGGQKSNLGGRNSSLYDSKYRIYDKDWRYKGYAETKGKRTVIYDKDSRIKGYVMESSYGRKTYYDKDWKRKANLED